MRRLRTLSAAFFVLVTLSAVPAAFARPAERVGGDFRGRIRRAVEEGGGKVVIGGVPLGGKTSDTIELEPMEVWAADASIIVYESGGQSRTTAPPDARYFKGRVVGDDESTIFLSIEKGKIDGIVLVGAKRFRIGSAVRLPNQRGAAPNADEAPVVVGEIDDTDDMADPASRWLCDVDNYSGLSSGLAAPGVSRTTSGRTVQGNAGNVAGATYQLRIAIETDAELFAAFGSAGALSSYLGNLVGAASTIYQRDLKAQLFIGDTHLYSGGTGSDPWTVVPGVGSTSDALAELGTYWHNNFPAVQRSSVVMVSGKSFNGGVAWTGTLCGGDAFCGADGSNCGSPLFAGKYAGAYAFCGSLSGPGGVTTTLPDPNLTINGIQYGLPSGSIFWMLSQFAHELGHNANSRHSSCVSLTAADKTLYGVTRDFVDICLAGGVGCYSGTTSYPGATNPLNPNELGTIMSYCHNLLAPSGFRASRYMFGKAGEASEKMLPIFSAYLEAETPNGTITSGAAPLPCAAGQTASVPACTNCTYQWSISGGTITGGATSTSITYTPSGPSTVLTVTSIHPSGCGITTSRPLATSCAAIAAPTGIVAAATTSTSVSISWNAVVGAVSYQVFRSDNGTSFSQIGAPILTTYPDTTAAANTAYLYRVRAVDAGSNASPDSTRDLATTVIFTDSLGVGGTNVRAVHFTELRTAVNSVRILAGLGAAAFTDPTLPAEITIIKAVHLTELRSSLVSARSTLTLGVATFTEPTIAVNSTTIKAAHISDLRSGVQ